MAGSAPLEAQTGAATEVDVAIVLAVDISFSMDDDEQRLQRQGYVEALRSEAIGDAIRKGVLGRIALTYVEWAGTASQEVIVPWQIVDGPESAAAFADKLNASPLKRAYRTSISGAIEFSARLLDDAPVRPLRRVIDVSGDGPNNQGRPVTLARDEAVARSITINGLPLLLKKPGYLDIEELDVYYEDCVIGGLGSFVVPIRALDQFAEATRHKLLLEISEPLPAPDHRISAAQEKRARVPCVIGERQWNDRMGN